MTQQTTDQALVLKMLVWVLGSMTTLASYVAYIQNQRANDWKELNLQKDAIIMEMKKAEVYEKYRTDKRADSLSGLILNRTDRNFEELKKIMNIKTNTSTITIKPKEKE